VSLKETSASIDFKDNTIAVGVDTDPFGGREIIAQFDARRLHPFTAQASDPHLFDLLDFCVALNALDRFSRRPQDGWTRRFLLRMPVSDPQLWKRSSSLISEWIYALTNDEVEVIPVARGIDGKHHRRSPNLTLDEPVDKIGLVSDGLDSLCGVDAASRSTDCRYAWASVVAGNRGPRIRRIIDLYATLAKGPVKHVTINLKIKNGNKAREKTQRSRTVTAIVMGFTAAYAMGARFVECYENGIGLLNLPVPDLQYGAMSTQVLHPKHLPLWDRISLAFFGRTIQLSFPNRFRTKSEMIRDLSPAASELLPRTFSCDAEARVKKKHVVHCGTCGSCRFRQLAVFDAGHFSDAKYAYTVRRENKIDAGRLLHYHAGLLSEALLGDDPWHVLCRLQPELCGVEYSDDDRLSNSNRESLRSHQESLRRQTMDLIRKHADSVSRWEEPHRAA
jgi:hypothetical protein